MHKHPLVVGVRQAAGWNTGESVEQTISQLGLNTGNMMFTESLCQVLAGAAWSSFALQPQDLEGRDVIVLAAANWINSYDDMGWLAERLERSSLPVIMVGVGAQSTVAMEMPMLKPGTLRLLHLVRDRSASIAARGAFSCEVLEHYGVTSAVPTGCPSLLLAGADGLVIRGTAQVDPATSCLHATRHGFQAAEPFQAFLYRQAYRRRMQLILQSELADFYLALGKTGNPGITTRALATIRTVYGDEDLVTVERYLRTHGHVFANIRDWLDYMRSRAFCFGTRIHGVIASLLAGTEATLIVHDSRTQEMAQAMFVPHVLSADIPICGDLDLARIHQPAQTAAFMARYPEYYSRFVGFFAQNGLTIAA